jgi:hypothetical protein
VQHVEAVDRGLDRMAEQRSRQRAGEASERDRAPERGWMERERDEAEDRAALRRELWARHHRRLAAVHAQLAERNRATAERLAGHRNGSGP